MLEVSVDNLVGNGAAIGHLSYVFLIASMLMTRMVWLRILAILSGLLAIVFSVVYFYDLVSAFWETVFVLTNVGQLAIISIRNRRTRFTPEERAFYHMVVPDLEPAEARDLLRIGTWMEIEEGDELAREGKPVSHLAYIVDGEVTITIGKQVVGRCGPNDFIGEISISTSSEATATATAATSVRYLGFERDALIKVLNEGRPIGRALEASFRRGLHQKLVRTNLKLTERPELP